MERPPETPRPSPAPGLRARLAGRRPLGVILLVLLGLITGGQSILAGFGFVGARFGSLGSLLSDPEQFKAVSVTFGVISIAAALATWQLWRVGWYATLLLAGAGLLLQIVLYVFGTANLLSLALYVASTFYLNQREVKALFLGVPTQATTVTLSRDEDDGA